MIDPYDLRLDPLWRDPAPRFGFHLAKLRAYEAINNIEFGGPTIITFLAVGAAESGLNSFMVGKNAINGTPPEHPAFRDVGLGTYQWDTHYIGKNVEAGHWTRERSTVSNFLGNVFNELDYMFACPGYVTDQHIDETGKVSVIEINFNLWASYKRGAHLNWIDEATDALQREDNAS